jgi:serine/threonine-protein phosphatase 2A regulatory subunit B'
MRNLLKSVGSKADKPPAASKGAPAAPAAATASAPPTAGGRPAAGPAGPAPTASASRAKPATGGFGSQNAAAAYSEPLPAFRDVPAGERQALFAKKLHLCSYTFDFNDAAKNAREKEIKRQTLLELVDYVNTGQGKFTEALFDDITFCLANNLFRALPPSGHETTGVGGGEAFDAEEEEPALEPAWPHLQARGPAKP